MPKKRSVVEKVKSKRPRGRPSKSKYDEPIKVDATFDEAVDALITVTPADLKEYRNRQGANR